MAEAVIEKEQLETADAEVSRVYEIGYIIVPTVAEADVEKVVGKIRGEIEKTGGSFIAEGAPSMLRLAYDMVSREGDKNVDHDRGYFGWLKFEASSEAAKQLDEILTADASLLRHLIFRTVREDTRAKMRAPVLREVKSGHSARPAPRREEGSAVPVSEAEIDKAISSLTTE